jgi:hypothetical protein
LMRSAGFTAAMIFAGSLVLAASSSLAQDTSNNDITDLATCKDNPLCTPFKPAMKAADAIDNYLNGKKAPPEPSPKAEALSHDADVAADKAQDAAQQQKERADSANRLNKDAQTPEQRRAGIITDDAKITAAMKGDCADRAFANGASFNFCQQQLTDLNHLEVIAKNEHMTLTSPDAAISAGYSRDAEKGWGGESHAATAAPQAASGPALAQKAASPDWTSLRNRCAAAYGDAPGALERANQSINTLNGTFDLDTPGQVQGHLDDISARGGNGLSASQVAEQQFTTCVLRERLKDLNGGDSAEVLKRGGDTGADLLKASLAQADAWEAGRPARDAKVKADGEVWGKIAAQQDAEKQAAAAQVAAAQQEAGRQAAAAKAAAQAKEEADRQAGAAQAASAQVVLQKSGKTKWSSVCMRNFQKIQDREKAIALTFPPGQMASVGPTRHARTGLFQPCIAWDSQALSNYKESIDEEKSWQENICQRAPALCQDMHPTFTQAVLAEIATATSDPNYSVEYGTAGSSAPAPTAPIRVAPVGTPVAVTKKAEKK